MFLNLKKKRDRDQEGGFRSLLETSADQPVEVNSHRAGCGPLPALLI